MFFLLYTDGSQVFFPFSPETDDYDYNYGNEKAERRSRRRSRRSTVRHTTRELPEMTVRTFRRDKPTIYWVYYPHSGQGWWRVSPVPYQPYFRREKLALWGKAHKLCQEMNRQLHGPRVGYTRERLRSLASSED